MAQNPTHGGLIADRMLIILAQREIIFGSSGTGTGTLHSSENGMLHSSEETNTSQMQEHRCKSHMWWLVKDARKKNRSYMDHSRKLKSLQSGCLAGAVK